MWEYKYFKTREKLNNWLSKNNDKTQNQEIFINNGFGVMFKKLKIINVK